MLRYQQGFPFGRLFVASPSHGSVRVLAGSPGTERQDDIVITDLRVEKTVRFANRRDLSVFFDRRNMFTSNPAQNLQWSSGTAYDRPLSVVPPRLAGIGARLNFWRGTQQGGHEGQSGAGDGRRFVPARAPVLPARRWRVVASHEPFAEGPAGA